MKKKHLLAWGEEKEFGHFKLSFDFVNKFYDTKIPPITKKKTKHSKIATNRNSLQKRLLY